jgi:hypothetical protein
VARDDYHLDLDIYRFFEQMDGFRLAVFGFIPLQLIPFLPPLAKVLFHCIKWLTVYTAVPLDS